MKSFIEAYPLYEGVVAGTWPRRRRQKLGIAWLHIERLKQAMTHDLIFLVEMPDPSREDVVKNPTLYGTGLNHILSTVTF